MDESEGAGTEGHKHRKTIRPGVLADSDFEQHVKALIGRSALARYFPADYLQTKNKDDMMRGVHIVLMAREVVRMLAKNPPEEPSEDAIKKICRGYSCLCTKRHSIK